MANNDLAKYFLDNATIAGAGRALYDDKPDSSDCISLAHLITAALLCDEIWIDGSSRFVPLKAYDVRDGKHKVTEPLAAIWTWEKRYPALADLCTIVDKFWQRQLGFDQRKVVEFLLEVVASSRPGALKKLDMDLIPAAYLSPDYFDRNWIENEKHTFEAQAGRRVSEQAFKVLLYAWRGIYYHEVSKLTGVTYFPNPQRSRFIEKFLVAGKSIFDYESAALKLIAQVIAQPRYNVIQQVAKEKESEFKLPISPFLSFVLQESKGGRADIVQTVRRLRDSKRFRDLRALIFEYDAAYRNNDLLLLKKMQTRINTSMRNFERRYSVTEAHLSIAPKISLGLLDVKGLEDFIKAPIPPVMFTELFQKPYLSLMWDVAGAVLKKGFGLERIEQLQPIPREEGANMEWVLMERSAIFRFEGESTSRDPRADEVFFEGEVAGHGNYGMYGYKGVSDMLDDTSRPAQPRSQSKKKK